MCSISGFITQRPIDRYQAERLASALLFHGKVRGEQSGGVYVNGKVYKEAEDPAKIIWKKEYSEMFREDTALVLGHTRQPTCGGRGDEQAQPFQHEKVTTIHNGYYFNIPEIKTKWGIDKGSGVDSELITSFVESYGILRLPDFIESTSGVSAIACLTESGLYFATAGNPINYVNLILKGGNRMLAFASTKEILEKALHHTFLSEDFKITEVPDGALYRVTPKRIKEMAKIDVSKTRWRANTTYNYGRGYTHGANWQDDMFDEEYGFGFKDKREKREVEVYDYETRTWKKSSEVDWEWKNINGEYERVKKVDQTKIEPIELKVIDEEEEVTKVTTLPMVLPKEDEGSDEPVDTKSSCEATKSSIERLVEVMGENQRPQIECMSQAEINGFLADLYGVHCD